MSKNKTKNILNFIGKIPDFFCNVYLVYMLFAVVMIAFCTSFFQPSFYANFTLDNWLFFLCAVAILLAIGAEIFAIHKFILNKPVSARPKQISTKIFTIMLIVVMVLLVAYQAILIKKITYIPIGDVQDITFNCFTDFSAIDASDGENFLRDYIQQQPNLRFLTGLFLGFYNAICASGMADFFNGFMHFAEDNAVNSTFAFYALQLLSCICVDASIVLAALVAKKYFCNNLALVVTFVSVVILGMSLCATVPYSDTFGMIVASTVLFVYAYGKRPWIKWPVVLLLEIIGYYIKPTIVAVGLAILIVEICHWASNKKQNTISKKSVYKTAGIVLGCCCTFGIAMLCLNIVTDFGIPRDYNKEIAYTHYLKMGLNYQTSGQYYQPDYQQAVNAETPEEQIQTDIETIQQRLSDMGPGGLIKLFIGKTFTNLGVGNFMSPVYAVLQQMSEENDPVFEAIYGISNTYSPSTYYKTDTESENHNVKLYAFEGANRTDFVTPYNVVVQVIWFMILIGIVSLFLLDNKPKIMQVMLITLFLLCGFLLIFESNQRYILLFLPYFIILGSVGIFSSGQALLEFASNKWIKKPN